MVKKYRCGPEKEKRAKKPLLENPGTLHIISDNP
jgi:hypothetical protein